MNLAVRYKEKDPKSTLHVVEEADAPGGKLPRAWLVDTAAPEATLETTLGSIGNHMPYTEWEPFAGDPAPVLALLREKLGVSS